MGSQPYTRPHPFTTNRHTHIHTPTHTHARKRIPLRTHDYMHKRVHGRTHTRKCAHTRLHANACKRASTNTRVHVCGNVWFVCVFCSMRLRVCGKRFVSVSLLSMSLCLCVCPCALLDSVTYVYVRVPHRSVLCASVCGCGCFRAGVHRNRLWCACVGVYVRADACMPVCDVCVCSGVCMCVRACASPQIVMCVCGRVCVGMRGCLAANCDVWAVLACMCVHTRAPLLVMCVFKRFVYVRVPRRKWFCACVGVCLCVRGVPPRRL